MHQIAIYKIKGIRHVSCCLSDTVLRIACARFAPVIALAARSLLRCAEAGDSRKLGSNADLGNTLFSCLSCQSVLVIKLSLQVQFKNPVRTSRNVGHLPRLYFMWLDER